MSDLVVAGGTIVTPGGSVQADVAVGGGRIERIVVIARIEGRWKRIVVKGIRHAWFTRPSESFASARCHRANP